jgi:hypothetical protein
MTTRDFIRKEREANNWALVRARATTWGATTAGRDMTYLLSVLDGKAVLTQQRQSEILLNVQYFRTTSGDGLGDDVLALVEAITEKAQ